MIMQYKDITMITSKLGKIKTALQFITIHLILIFLILKSYSVLIPSYSLYNESLYFLMIITTSITFYTGVHYFYHNYTLNMSSYQSGDVVFMKIYLQDNVNPVTEIPSNGSEYQIIKHFTFTVL